MPKVNVGRLSWFVAFLMLLLAGSAGAVRKKVFDLPLGGIQILERVQVLSSDGTTVTTRLVSSIDKYLGIESSDVLAEYFGDYVDESGNLLDISGNGRDLTLTGNNIRKSSNYVDPNGNSINAFYYDGSSYHSRVDEAWLSFSESAFTITVVEQAEPPVGGVNYNIVTRGNAFRALINLNNSYNQLSMYKNAGSSSTAVWSPFLGNWNFNVLHFVRNSSGYCYVLKEGVSRINNSGSQNLASCATYGVGTGLFYLGHGISDQNFVGKILFVRIVNKELSNEVMQKEVNYFRSIQPSSSKYPGLFYSDGKYTASSYSVYGMSQTGYPPFRSYYNAPISISDRAKFFNNSEYQFTWYGFRNDVSNGNWTQNYVTPSLNTAYGPSGTLTMDTLMETVDNGVHSISTNTATGSSSVVYVSAVMKPNGRNYGFLMHNKGGSSNPVIFDINKGLVISRDSDWTSAGVDLLPDGNAKVWALASGNGSSWKFELGPSDGTNYSYAGDTGKGIYIGEMTLNATNRYPSPLPNNSTGSTKTFLHYVPFSVSKDFLGSVNATPSLLIDGNENLYEHTTYFHSSVGNYQVDNAGIQKGYSDNLGNYFTFDNTTTIAGNPSPGLSVSFANGANDFNLGSNKVSFVFLVQPEVFALGSSMLEGLVTKTDWDFIIHTGSTLTIYAPTSWLTGTGCVTRGRPSLITFTYDGSGGNGATKAYIYQDACTPISSTTKNPIVDNNYAIGFAKGSALASNFQSKLGLVAVYRNYVISQAEHNNMYSKMKVPGIFPLTMSASTTPSKVIVDFQARGLYGTSSEIPSGTRNYFEISGVNGATGGSTKNVMNISVDTSGRFNAYFYEDSDATQRLMQTTARTDLNKWHQHRVVFDFSNSANSSYYIDGVDVASTRTNMTGTGNAFDFRDTEIFVGKGRGDTSADACDCEMKNVKIFTE